MYAPRGEHTTHPHLFTGLGRLEGRTRVTVTAVLALEDGTIFNGQSIGAKGNTTGEVVFNTALTGYQEILSDPSYSRQIVTLTYPHIGNTGTTPEDLEAPAEAQEDVAGGGMACHPKPSCGRPSAVFAGGSRTAGRRKLGSEPE